MLTCRVGTEQARNDGELDALCRAIAAHPLAERLEGTVIVGVGPGTPWRPDDTSPRIVVLHDCVRLSRIQRAHLAPAHGVLLSASSAAHRAARAAAPRAIIARVEEADRPFLRGADHFDTAAAWNELRERHAALAKVLGANSVAGGNTAVVEALVELAVALGN